jgi:Icc-related predicted phosphoesterase
MKILFAGDTHASLFNLQKLFHHAHSTGCEMILVLGDFGYFPHLKYEKSVMLEVSKLSKHYNIPLYFVKGNHDNHEILAKYSEITELHPGIFFIPNGLVTKFGNYTFYSAGGAYSIDKAKRQPFVDYWETETLSHKDLRQSEGKRADFILSHDCPISVDINYFLGYKIDEGTRKHRRMLQAIVDDIRPKVLIHGHYHAKIREVGLTPDGEFKSIGLGSNKQKLDDQILVVDTTKTLEEICRISNPSW